MMGLSASLAIALASMAAVGNTEVAAFSHRQLTAGQAFEIRTADCVYRGQMVDSATGECQVATSTDGTTFTQPRTVYLLGSTVGPQARQMLVLMHDVKVGLKLELGLGNLEAKNRLITSEVKSIKLGG
jgi:hypothetical protein